MVLLAVSTIDASQGYKYKSARDAWTVSNTAIISMKAEEIATGGEYVDENGNLMEYVGVRYYPVYEGNIVVPSVKYNLLYQKDAINPENNNAIKKQAIVDKAMEVYGWTLALQDVRYNKKVPGNQ